MSSSSSSITSPTTITNQNKHRVTPSTPVSSNQSNHRPRSNSSLNSPQLSQSTSNPSIYSKIIGPNLKKSAVPSIDESLRSFKLLEALRSGDPNQILPLLAQSQDHLSSTQDSDSPSHQITPLHLAVRCASTQTVQLVLSNSKPKHLVTQDTSGQTPLHIACALGRSDVVALLLAQAQVDDSIRDHDSKTCLELCKHPEVAKLIQVSRAHLSGSFLALLSAYIASPPTAIVSQAAVDSISAPSTNEGNKTPINNHESAADQLFKLLHCPRAKLINYNLKEEQSGTTLLHEAARRRDLHLLGLAISRGADVLARDRRNKMPIDVAKDEKVKGILRQTATSEGRALLAHAQSKIEPSGLVTSLSTSSVLGNPTSSLGLVSTQQPTLKGYLSKWTNMAKGYNTRWIVLDNGYLSYYRDQKDEGKAVRGSIAMSVAILTGPDVTKDKLRFEVSSKLGSSYPKFYLKGAHPVEVMRWVDALKQAIELAKDSSPHQPPHLIRKSSSPSMDHPEQRTPSQRRSFVPRRIRNSRVLNRSPKTNHSSPEQGEDSPSGSMFAGSFTDDDNYGIVGQDGKPPFNNEFHLLSQSVKAHIEMTEQLIDSITISNSPISNTTSNLSLSSSPSSPNLIKSTQRQVEVKEALKRSMQDLNTMVSDYFTKVNQREKFYIRRYEQELTAKKLWEENMQLIVASQAEMEEELKEVVRDSSRRKKQLKTLRAGMSGGTPAGLVGPGSSEYVGEIVTPSGLASNPTPGIVQTSPIGDVHQAQSAHPLALSSSVDSEDDEDDDDEFFEAIETGAIALEPMAVSKASLEHHRVSELDISVLCKGYETKRKTLPIKADDRPSVSLWGVLKNSIGKDLTKISFPVTFNEPVSMLQRMAEDMQFSECLDAAAEHQDSLVRLAYVAGFAMSNYSSTVGRLAKPFNPLLGETFEYVDPDKQYRYVSEQVSHHPPTSACYCDSIRWKYFGETDAKNRFTGKSFEIKPTGVAHATLKLPKTFPGTEKYPEAEDGTDRVEEHYSWKKVTTIVSNFILGSPSIDHYGDMEITNHRTGEKCILTFKPRGWRGKDANEVKGSVYDSNGKVVWELAGKWTTQLIARKAGGSNPSDRGELAPDQKVEGRGREYMLIWKNEEILEPLPFNLTNFAIALNAVNPTLKNFLPPTDSRLRPDQHAFERGAWEKANELKSALEDFQRSKRKRRELGELDEHVPRWFKVEEDEDSGERTWGPIKTSDGSSIAYWEERLKVGKAKMNGDQSVEWSDVDHIFGEFELIDG
ncbi:Oxysterol-binding protein-domain-containing protein [Melampsora americana]|nr:Oxysterol-binding protein-domain-containing protein [Melampsora americana]